jgi:outer membrane protein insertion porin family
MVRRIVLLVLLLLVVPAVVTAEDTVSVGVTPFAIHSQDRLEYLSQGIQEMIGNHLMQRGLIVSDQAAVAKALGRTSVSAMDEGSAKRIGQTLGVDYVVYGSLTKIGQTLSLDTRIVDSRGRKMTQSVFVQEEGLDNINAAAEKLAKEVTARVSSRQKIDQIQVEGNDRIETDAIRRVVESQEGDVYSEAVVAADLKRIYNMEYFDDVSVDVQDSPQGKIVKFLVQEKPVITSIEITGYRRLEKEDLMAVVGYSVYSIVNPRKIVESVENMKAAYREKGYYNAEIKYAIEPIEGKKVAVKYDIDEGDKIYIKAIEFTGNEAFSDRRLRREMETSQKNMLSWVLGTGVLKDDALKTDIKRVNAFYLNNGYLEAKVGDPEVKTEEGGLTITIPVSEGPQYRVGQLGLAGDLVVPEETIREELKLATGDIVNRQLVQEDVEKITALTADQGYAFAEVQPQLKQNVENNTVDITYHVAKKGLVTFERITVVGNDRTRDKVIRRELKVKEGELFSSEGLRVSNINLERLGYFAEVQIVQSQGTAEDKMNLDVKVKEQSTGAFSVGAGYSSYNSLFGTVSIRENNLFGTGRKLSIEATVGGRSDEYILGFTEPWLFDIPLSAGFDIFNRQIDYDEYERDSIGFDVRAGYPIMDFTTLSGRYMYEYIDVQDVSSDAAKAIKDIEGESDTSSLMASIRRDSRNKYFNPTKGSDNSFSVEYAGGPLGGSNAFTRMVASSGWLIPMPWEESAFLLKGKGGYLIQGPGDLPAYEKFYLGGINSVRGFGWSDISPRDPATGDKIGGERMAVFNVEFTFPLVKSAGVIGVVFFDQGNVWTEEQGYDLGDLKRSYGGGIRYNSPLGPLRIEYGQVLDPEEGDPTGQWEFSVGTFF